MAKARHVGSPHSLQFVLGNCLNISKPVKAIAANPFLVVTTQAYIIIGAQGAFSRLQSQ
jgi:hypothetical protein